MHTSKGNYLCATNFWLILRRVQDVTCGIYNTMLFLEFATDLASKNVENWLTFDEVMNLWKYWFAFIWINRYNKGHEVG